MTQRFARGLEDFPADDAQSVDLQHAGDLREEPLDEPEVPAGDAVDGVADPALSERSASCPSC
jgi:hypothetical protein